MAELPFVELSGVLGEKQEVAHDLHILGMVAFTSRHHQSLRIFKVREGGREEVSKFKNLVQPSHFRLKIYIVNCPEG